MTGHDARQVGDAADESPELVVGADDADLDRQLDVEVGRLLVTGFEQLEFEAGAEALLRNVDEQLGDLGLVGQALEEVPEGLLDVLELLLQGRQVGGFLLLAFELDTQVLLGAPRVVEFDPQVLDVVLPAEEADQGEDDDGAADFHRQWPTPEVLEAEVVEVVHVHRRYSSVPASSSDFGFDCCTVRMKSATRRLSRLAVWMIDSLGFCSHSESSTLRM